jgi:hypothetical protein
MRGTLILMFILAVASLIVHFVHIVIDEYPRPRTAVPVAGDMAGCFCQGLWALWLAYVIWHP